MALLWNDTRRVMRNSATQLCSSFDATRYASRRLANHAAVQRLRSGARGAPVHAGRPVGMILKDRAAARPLPSLLSCETPRRDEAASVDRHSAHQAAFGEPTAGQYDLRMAATAKAMGDYETVWGIAARAGERAPSAPDAQYFDLYLRLLAFAAETAVGSDREAPADDETQQRLRDVVSATLQLVHTTFHIAMANATDETAQRAACAARAAVVRSLVRIAKCCRRGHCHDAVLDVDSALVWNGGQLGLPPLFAGELHVRRASMNGLHAWHAELFASLSDLATMINELGGAPEVGAFEPWREGLSIFRTRSSQLESLDALGPTATAILVELLQSAGQAAAVADVLGSKQLASGSRRELSGAYAEVIDTLAGSSPASRPGDPPPHAISTRDAPWSTRRFDEFCDF